MQVGLGEETIEATCPLARKVHQWTLRVIGGFQVSHNGPVGPVLPMLQWPGVQEDVLFRLPAEFTEPAA
jgi:hypothetical protein